MEARAFAHRCVKRDLKQLKSWAFQLSYLKRLTQYSFSKKSYALGKDFVVTIVPAQSFCWCRFHRCLTGNDHARTA